jgi:hypothetical protein
LLFAVVMVILAGVVGFEVMLVLKKRGHAQEAQKSFYKQVEDYQRLLHQRVLPAQQNIELTRQEIERQREELEIYTSEMRGRRDWAAEFARHPVSGPDSVFEIITFAEEYRRRAAVANVTMANLDNEFFGFQAYSQTGPNEANLATVHKQRLIVGHLLDRIFAAQPETLISVRRPGEGRGPAAADTGERAAPGDRGGAVGTAGFSLNPQLSAAISGIAETMPFEVVFTGRSSTLRTFLNDLASFEMPLIVRSVEVSSLTESGRRGDGEQAVRRRRAPGAAQEETPATRPDGAPPRDENVELVSDNLSRFTVTIEFIDLVQPANARR